MQLNQKQKELLLRFKTFISLKSKLALILSLLIFVCYYAFVLGIGLFPDVLGYQLGPSSISLGIILGIFLMLLCMVATGVYTFIANYFFDKEQNAILKDLQKEGLLEPLENGELDYKENV